MTAQTIAGAVDEQLRRMTPAAAIQLCDTTEHAAVTALVVVITNCVDPVRAQSARKLYPLIYAAAEGDGTQPRRRAAALASLVDGGLATLEDSDESRRSLMLSLEQWLLHPGRGTSTALVTAAGRFVHSPMAPCPELLEQAWVVGPGMDAAAVALRDEGLDSRGAQAYLSLITMAAELAVPMVWVAKELGVPRDQIYRRIRTVDRQAWRSLLP